MDIQRVKTMVSKKVAMMDERVVDWKVALLDQKWAEWKGHSMEKPLVSMLVALMVAW